MSGHHKWETLKHKRKGTLRKLLWWLASQYDPEQRPGYAHGYTEGFNDGWDLRNNQLKDGL